MGKEDKLKEFLGKNENIKINRKILPWHQRVMMKFFPRMWLRYHARKMDIDDTRVDSSMNLFDNAARIDIHPSRSNSRGFQIVIDNNFALYFYQDGNAFKFDGFEMGEYGDGDVTIFDHIDR